MYTRRTRKRKKLKQCLIVHMNMSMWTSFMTLTLVIWFVFSCLFCRLTR